MWSSRQEWTTASFVSIRSSRLLTIIIVRPLAVVCGVGVFATGSSVGIKAKTHYPPRPEGLEGPWPPDEVFAHIQAGLLVGKVLVSYHWKPTSPTRPRPAGRGWPDSVRLVIDRWLLLEYACVSIPANPLALVESVTKMAVGYTTFDEIAQAIERRVRAADIAGLVRRAVATALERLRGRV
jgi:hypothetical protein